MTSEAMKDLVVEALEELKGVDVRVLDVREATTITDYMVIASGTSDRHVRSLAQNLERRTKEAGYRPLGVEGEREGDWVLIDLGDVVAHIMMPRVRDFYNLEKLWSVVEGVREQAEK